MSDKTEPYKCPYCFDMLRTEDPEDGQYVSCLMCEAGRLEHKRLENWRREYISKKLEK